MHQLNLELSDDQFEDLKLRASTAGFSRVEAYIVDRLSAESGPTDKEIAARFTPEIVAHLEQIAEDMDSGNEGSLDDVDARIEQMRQIWRNDRAS